MLVIEPVCNGNVFFVPAVLPGLFSADEQDRASAMIEGIEHAIRPSSVLNAQLAHVAVLRACDAAGMGKRKTGAEIGQKLHAGANRFLFSLGQPVPPGAKFVGVLYLPLHVQ